MFGTLEWVRGTLEWVRGTLECVGVVAIFCGWVVAQPTMPAPITAAVDASMLDLTKNRFTRPWDFGLLDIRFSSSHSIALPDFSFYGE